MGSILKKRVGVTARLDEASHLLRDLRIALAGGGEKRRSLVLGTRERVFKDPAR
jgi:hypothetical protein